MSSTNVTEAEEEAMRELLNRSDTAIIYPEPVSDNEESEGEIKRGKFRFLSTVIQNK